MKITINNREYEFEKGQTILEVARANGIKIPTLCYLKNICQESSCRICMVELGNGRLVTSCSTLAEDGMVVKTNSQAVINSRKNTLKLLVSNHNGNCQTCYRSGDCYFQELLRRYNITDAIKGDMQNHPIDNSSPCIVRDPNKCILCGRCKEVCEKVQSVSALTKQKRGFNTLMGCAFNAPIDESTCIGCGQCVLSCPTGALVEHNYLEETKELLANKDYFVVAQIAPSVRVSLAEAFGEPIGTFDEGRMVEALKMVGFAKVFDVNLSADLTIMEEAGEFVERLSENKNLPLFTSCCPGWFGFVQKFYPEYLNNLSTAKSPAEMLGAVIKNYYVEKEGIPYDKIKVVSIMPCTAKKREKQRFTDVDISLTTRECAKLIKEADIDYVNLKGMEFDLPFQEYSGAGLIFGVTGGVMEAALRRAINVLEPDAGIIDFTDVRYSKGLKEVAVKVAGKTINIAIVNGLANARKLLEDIKAGRKEYQFIEVMACPGGCVNGGGQCFVDYNETPVEEVIKARTASLYNKDKSMTLRQSDKNVTINEFYNNFLLGTPEKVKKLLHWRHED